MSFGSNVLKRGSTGDDVIELQLRLSGFRGTVWDGDFGPGTELQVVTFQRDFMRDENPDGIVGPNTFNALQAFKSEYQIDFEKLKCPCGGCDGFGNEKFKGEYRPGKPHLEAFHHYEYPGIHKAILHTYQAAAFYSESFGFRRPLLTSGYRCWINNEQKGRSSTNHMGKALDFDLIMNPGEDKEQDMEKCDNVRGLLVEKCGFQIGWGAKNRKALEPSNIAPTWIHMDVRSYDSKYLQDSYFKTSM